MFCCTLFCVHSSIAVILMGKRELVALLKLSSWCLVMVERLFLAVPRGCLRFVIVVFPDHTDLLFLLWNRLFQNLQILQAFARHYSKRKIELFEAFFPKFSSDKITLCNNKDQTWFSDARPLRVVKTPAFHARVSTPPSGSSRC